MLRSLEVINPGPLLHPKYRADIDGLRAVAVLAVVGFHAFPKEVPGGFIGVDIFFVISGFLISTILFQNLESNTFRFLTFYARRIRRIFPALLVVLAANLSIGWFMLLADKYERLGKHAAGGAGFVSNLLFWKESGYFDGAAATKPLLHLWSLGIEEQFYLIWPLVLWIGWKARINLLALTMAMGLASLTWDVAVVSRDSASAFYLPMSRFWELLAGAVLAHISLKRPTSSAAGPWCNLRSVLGSSLILAGLLLINGERAFPGWWAILPTLGTTLIISAGPRAWLNRTVLSRRVLVWVGLISYPLYLWHWPLLAIPRIVEGVPPPLAVRTAAVVLSIALAWATYRLVETPLRFSKRGSTAIVLLVSMLAVGAAGSLIYGRSGLPTRAATKAVVRNDGDVGHVLFHRYAVEHFYPCMPIAIREEATALAFGEFGRCLQSKKDAPIDVAIIGDSHAEHLFLGLAELLEESECRLLHQDDSAGRH